MCKILRYIHKENKYSRISSHLGEKFVQSSKRKLVPTSASTVHQCCGSGSESGSTGSTCFWASWIRIRIHQSEVCIRIRIWILLSLVKIPGIPAVDAERPTAQPHPHLGRVIQYGGRLGGQRYAPHFAASLRFRCSVEQHPPVVRSDPDQIGG
jgi:hypothetical protein